MYVGSGSGWNIPTQDMVDAYEAGSNFPVYRFADVLLMLAGCLNETGFTAAAIMQAHAVREKALKSYLAPAAYSTIRLTYQYPRREVQLSN